MMLSLRVGAVISAPKLKQSVHLRKISQAQQAGGSIWSSAVSGVKRTLSSDAYIQGAKSGLPQDAIFEKVWTAKNDGTDHLDAYRDAAQKLLWTQKELNQATKNYATGWHNAPIPADHKMGVVLQNESENVVAFLACLRAGIVYVGIPPSCTAEHLGRIIEQAQLRALLATQSYIEKEVVPLVPELENPLDEEVHDPYLLSRKFPTLRYVMTTARKDPLVIGTAPMREFQLLNPVPDPLPRMSRAIRPHATAAAFYTPHSLRAHTHSHAALVHAASSAGKLLGLGSGDRVLATLPMHTVQGHTLGALMGTLAGAVVVNPAPRPDATLSLQSIAADRANILVMTPGFARELIASPKLKKVDLSSVKRVVLVASDSAASQAAHAAAAEIRSALNNAQVLLGLALPQVAGLVTLRDISSGAGAGSAAGSLGSATPDVELRVTRADGSTARTGESGRLMLKGPAVSRGALGDKPAAAEWVATELSAAIGSDASVTLSS